MKGCKCLNDRYLMASSAGLEIIQSKKLFASIIHPRIFAKQYLLFEVQFYRFRDDPVKKTDRSSRQVRCLCLAVWPWQKEGHRLSERFNLSHNKDIIQLESQFALLIQIWFPNGALSCCLLLFLSISSAFLLWCPHCPLAWFFNAATFVEKNLSNLWKFWLSLNFR